MSFFKTAVLIVFGIGAIIGITVFAVGGLGFGGDGENSVGSVTVWGTMPADHFESLVRGASDAAGDQLTPNDVTYAQKSPETFRDELTNALAANRGPDAIVLPNRDLQPLADKLQRIPYEQYSQRRFRDTFVQGAEVYTTADGLYGLPVSVDPLVLYWNRSILSSAGIANPPRFWSEVVTLSEQVTRRDEAGNIELATIGLGEFDNVDHAKAIISAMTMQVGGEIMTRTSDGLEARLTTGTAPGTSRLPAVAALDYYTQFANPSQSVYTWNRSKAHSREAFLATDVATYIGFASELPQLRDGNPNLNFDVTMLPQTREGAEKLTYGRFQAIGIPKGSAQDQNVSGALQLATLLSGNAAIERYTERTVYPPVRRDLLEDNADTAFESTFQNAALVARTWVDPQPEQTDTIFREMVRSITSGRRSTVDAVRAANGRLQNVIQQ